MPSPILAVTPEGMRITMESDDCYCAPDGWWPTLQRTQLALYCYKFDVCGRDERSPEHTTQVCELSHPVAFSTMNPYVGGDAAEAEYELLARSGAYAIYWDGARFFYSTDPRRRVLESDVMPDLRRAVSWLEERASRSQPIIVASAVQSYWQHCVARAEEINNRP